MPAYPQALHQNEPHWETSARLLKSGESIRFSFFSPHSCASGPLRIYAHYLEHAGDLNGWKPESEPDWLDTLPVRSFSLYFKDRRATLDYTPAEPGNYLAVWQAGEERLYRYFAVISDESIVLRFSTFGEPDPQPTLHATGIPLDYWLPVTRFEMNDPLFGQLLSSHRRFGDGLIPRLPDTPPAYGMDKNQRLALYRMLLDKARAMMPFPQDIRSARLEKHHDIDPGYPELLQKLGIVDFCGLHCANARPWLGMPEFPYFAAANDCRRTDTGGAGALVAHQWDFTAGWHFIGPASWHYKVSEGDWPVAERCIRQGLEELELLTRNSGHPAFAYPLYDGVLEPGYPNPDFRCQLDAESATGTGLAMPDFVNRYIHFIAFKATRHYNLVFARSVDIADYFIRHYQQTPQTLFSTMTDHIFYDMWWLWTWCADGHLVTQEKIPAATRLSKIATPERKFKDPLSCETLLFEDHQRSVRFESLSPHPVWWFEYGSSEQTREGSTIHPVQLPEVHLQSSGWQEKQSGFELVLQLKSSAPFSGYLLVLWQLPLQFHGDATAIDSDAHEVILVRNRQGALRMILCFDLELETKVTLFISKCLKSKKPAGKIQPQQKNK